MNICDCCRREKRKCWTRASFRRLYVCATALMNAVLLWGHERTLLYSNRNLFDPSSTFDCPILSETSPLTILVCYSVIISLFIILVEVFDINPCLIILPLTIISVNKDKRFIRRILRIDAILNAYIIYASEFS